MSNNKNNDKKKLNSTLAKFASAGLVSSVAFAVASPLIINAVNHQDSKNTSARAKLATTAPAAAASGAKTLKDENNKDVTIGLPTVGLPKNESPDFIYFLPVFSDDVFKDINNIVKLTGKIYLDSIQNYEISADQALTKQYSDAYTSAVVMAALGTQSSLVPPEILSQYQNAKNLLSLPTTSLEAYNKLNGFGNKVEPNLGLKIRKPKEVRNLLAPKFSATSGIVDKVDQSNALLKTTDFAYQVAKIDLSKLKDAKSLIFDYKDNASMDQGDYKIVISNENKEIERFMGGGATTNTSTGTTTSTTTTTNNTPGDIDELLKNQTIFVRDMNAEAEQPDAGKISVAKAFDGKIKFVFDGVKTLSLLVMPDDDNMGDKYISIKSNDYSDKAAIKAMEFGFFDNTLSPRYLKKFTAADLTKLDANNTWDASSWMGTNLDDVYGQDKKLRGGAGATGSVELLTELKNILASSIPVFSQKGKWFNNAPAGTIDGVRPGEVNWIRFFMGYGTKISKPLKFANTSAIQNDQVFANDSDLSVDFSAGIKAVSPLGGITLKQKFAEGTKIPLLSTAQIAVASAEIKNPITNDDYDKYLKTDIGLNSGIMSINASANDPKEQVFELEANPAKKIFFEDPFSLTTKPLTPADAVIAANPDTIRTAPEIATANMNQELISRVVENWANKPSSSSTRILTQKEFFDVFKQIPAYKSQFDDLEVAVKDLKKLKDEKDQLEKAIPKDSSAIGQKDHEISQQQIDIDLKVKAMKGFLPIWPTNIPKTSVSNQTNSYMIFDESMYEPAEQQSKADGKDFKDLKNKLEDYTYHFTQYMIDEDGAIVNSGSTTYGLHKYTDSDTDELGLNAQNNMFNFELDASGKTTTVAATGMNIYKHFIKYTNEIFRWERDKLNVSDAKDDNFYLLADGQSGGWVKRFIVEKAGAAGTELLNIANVFARIWIGSPLQSSEVTIKNQFDELFGNNYFPGWESLIKDKGNAEMAGYDVNSPAYIVSQQLIYAMIQPYLVKCFDAILTNETSMLSSKILSSTKQAFEDFFKQTTSVLQISDDAIKYVDAKEDINKNMKFITAGSYEVKPAANGSESLKSLIKFIYASGISLENIGLSTDELNSFQSYAADIDTNLSNETLFDQSTNETNFTNFVSLLSKILEYVINDPTAKSLNDIAVNIQKASYDKASSGGVTAVSDLTDIIQKAIKAIMSDTKAKEINVLGAQASYSYLESLVIGRNLYEIYTEYLRRIPDNEKDKRKDEIKEITDFLAQNKQYDQSSIINLSFALGYHNIAYFIERLTNPNEIESLADEMLKYDLSKSVQLKIDSGNEVVNFLSNPKTLAKYSFMGLGGALTLAGGSIFGLSFRKSIRMSRKNVIIERFIFMGIIGLGLALTLFGVIPSIL